MPWLSHTVPPSRCSVSGTPLGLGQSSHSQVPFAPARDGQDATLGQFLGDGAGSQPLDEQPEDEPHGLGLLLVDGEVAVLTLVVAKETGVAHGEFAVSELFSQSPSHVLRNAPRLLLAKGRDDCE